MAIFTALYDACVLYPAPLRDLLMHLAMTYNLGDFPKRVLDPLGIEAQHPDVFVVRLFGLDGPAVCAAARRQRQSLRNPPKTVDEFLEILAQQQMPKTIAKLREFAAIL